MNPNRANKIWFIGLGILAMSFASILIKLCDAPALVIAAYRLAIAAAFYTLWVMADKHKNRRQLANLPWKALLMAGLFLALHFAAWIASLASTSVASSVVLVQLSPVFVAFGSLFILQEKVTRFQWLGILLAVLGAITIGAHDFYRQQSSLAGNILAVVGAMGSAGYFVAGRICRKKMDTAQYVAVVYAIAAAATIFCLALLQQPLFGYPSPTLLLLLAIAIGPQIIGHTSLNWALKYFSATQVAIIVLIEPVGASLLALFLLHEPLSLEKIAGALLILFGVGLAWIKVRE
ncbi:MAG TPA: DMT family transporter [bacterium]|nr:DMT family transporter [bacterium]HNT65732.1 DMT family transporter [bacterium]